jgi:hypothetical protein
MNIFKNIIYEKKINFARDRINFFKRNFSELMLRRENIKIKTHFH